MAEIVRGELHLPALFSARQFGQRHDPGIVDQHVHRLGAESGGKFPDGHEIGDVEECRRDSVVSGGFGDLGSDLASGVKPTDTEGDVGAGSRQRARSLHPDA